MFVLNVEHVRVIQQLHLVNNQVEDFHLEMILKNDLKLVIIVAVVVVVVD
jgi:hypothetical protein